MKKKCLFFSVLGLLLISSFTLFGESEQEEASKQLYEIYNDHCQVPHNINQHLPTLKMLSQECSSVMEIGVFNIFTTWGILQGLAESEKPNRTYIGVDIQHPPIERFKLAQTLATQLGIGFNFWVANDLNIRMDHVEVDLLFIDSLHTYCHLTAELEKFSPHVKKYIAMHDTSPPWDFVDDNVYYGDYSEYPAHIDRNKRGLWPAVEDFLRNHPEWCLHARYYNNHGFTILRRIDLQEIESELGFGPTEMGISF